MNQRFNNFIHGLREVKLEDASFARIRATLASYADLHSVSDGALLRATSSPFIAFFAARATRYAGVFAVLLILVGGGTISGAERAVPGDALYGFKVNVTEKVSASLAGTPIERAEFATKLATRRADEALILLEQGKLDEDTATYLDQEVAKNVDVANTAATTIESEGDLATSLSVRTELETQLAERIAVLDAESEATVAMEAAADATAFSRAKVAPLPEEPGARFAQGLRVHLMRVAEARSHTAASILPGLADADVDLEGLRPESSLAEAPADVGATVSATLMIAADEAATTTGEELVPVRAKFAPPPNNAWPETEPFWLPGER